MTRSWTTRTRGGVTLIEMLVALTLAGIAISGLGTIYMSAGAEYANWAQLRERRYSRMVLETDLIWLLRGIPTDGYRPNAAAWANVTINFNDPVIGNQVRTVLTYRRVRTHLGTTLNAQPPQDLVTGVIYQWGTVVYAYECPENAIPGFAGVRDFNLLSSGQLQTFTSTLGNRQGPGSRILAINVDRLDFRPFDPDGGGPQPIDYARVDYDFFQF